MLPINSIGTLAGKQTYSVHNSNNIASQKLGYSNDVCSLRSMATLARQMPATAQYCISSLASLLIKAPNSILTAQSTDICYGLASQFSDITRISIVKYSIDSLKILSILLAKAGLIVFSNQSSIQNTHLVYKKLQSQFANRAGTERDNDPRRCSMTLGRTPCGAPVHIIS
jgi:hypothetical protein